MFWYCKFFRKRCDQTSWSIIFCCPIIEFQVYVMEQIKFCYKRNDYNEETQLIMRDRLGLKKPGKIARILDVSKSEKWKCRWSVPSFNPIPPLCVFNQSKHHYLQKDKVDTGEPTKRSKANWKSVFSIFLFSFSKSDYRWHF